MVRDSHGFPVASTAIKIWVHHEVNSERRKETRCSVHNACSIYSPTCKDAWSNPFGGKRVHCEHRKNKRTTSQ